MLSFSPNEKKTVKIVCPEGSIGDIEAIAGENITLRALAGKEISIVSQGRCSALQGTSYDDFRSMFDFREQFRLDSDACSYGPNPPQTTSVFIRKIPIVFEASDGLLKTGFARLSVW
jgi:hypothetical protein